MNKNAGIKTHSDAVLADMYYTSQQEKEFFLECRENVVNYYVKPSEEQKSLDVFSCTVEDFCNGIKISLFNGNIYFAGFDGEKLTIKKGKFYAFGKYVFTLTDSVKSNPQLMNFLSLLPTLQPNYDVYVLEDKYTDKLAGVYYRKEPLKLDSQESLDEFKKFYEAKRKFLTSNRFKSLEGLRKKLSGYFSNVGFLILLDLIVAPFGGWPFNFFYMVVLKVAILTGKLFATELIFKGIADLLVRHQVGSAIDDNQREIRRLVIEASKVETLDKEKALEDKEDPFIRDIKADMERVNACKYEGHQQHLDILYGLACLYLKAKKKNVGGTPLTLFGENESILISLVAIEREIEASINGQRLDQSNDAILNELAKLVIQSETQEQAVEKDEEGYGGYPGMGLKKKM